MNVAAIVLAAGRGARFDAARGKLLADYGGRPLVRHAVEAALGSKASKTIIVTGHARDEIERALAGLPVVFAYNPDFASGMASSLRAGLAHAADSAGALALLADMPDVTSAILDRLIAAFNCAPERVAVAPVYQGRRGNPVLLGRSLFPRLALLKGDDCWARPKACWRSRSMTRACSRILIRERTWRGRWAEDCDATRRAEERRARHANSTPSFFSGTERMRLPVAAK
jgi:molybdenum cofactor cytidylyltransferase